MGLGFFVTTNCPYCGNKIKTEKTKKIQCRECGERFNIGFTDFLPPLCPDCGVMLSGKLGTAIIFCKKCDREWYLTS